MASVRNSDRSMRHRISVNTGGHRRKAVLGLFVALAAVLAVAPLVSAGQTETVACCGPIPK
ncbi:hypothetical protein UK15_37940 [Streptomyces variegatus]|uniref:Uncharacterized protein n=1 Tax=Streptomyces variegatus TaxID=284040 RepID=A0A0M2GGM5_9ACTN|nr:hypothetical protein UK15_37940 [Streptomyces variegatus]